MVVFVLISLAFAAPVARDDEPPVAGRPAQFSGAVGEFVSMTASAAPTEVALGEPLIYTLRIKAAALPRTPPTRPQLRRLREFAERFLIEDMSPRLPSDQTTWEFQYQLRPRRADVEAIPAFRFDFFKPGVVPPERGYQTRYADAIPLTVRAPARLGAPLLEPPASVREIVEGPAILRRDEPFPWPQPWTVVLFLAGVPLLCIGTVLLSRAYDNRAGGMSARRAARTAFRALRRAKTLSAEDAANITATYLREAWSLPPGEPTPRALAVHLRAQQCESDAVTAAVDFWESCDRTRFRPNAPPDSDLVPAARRLVAVLESQKR